MNKILFLILIIPATILSQNRKQDLYIAYDDCSIHQGVKIVNDTLKFETYTIRFGDKMHPAIIYSVNQSGEVVKDVQMIGKTFPSLLITYKNQNNNNPAIKIDPDQIENKIWAKDIIHAENTDFATFFDKFRNVYIVDFSDEIEEIKVARKVEITFTPTL